MTEEKTNAIILERNYARFNWVQQRALLAFEQRKFNQAVGWAYIAGFCAWRAHMGQFAHPGLEFMLHNIGADLKHPNRMSRPATYHRFSQRRWLHVLSSAFGIGGHTRLVQQWIRKDHGGAECHSVILTDQRNYSAPDWLKEVALATGGDFNVLPPSMSIFERACALRELAMNGADIIVLHTNPNDPLPLLAFAQEGLPPIILMNHADHVFWFGATVADAVADLRPSAQVITRSRRLVENSQLLPIPLEVPALSNESKEMIRKRLGLPESATILLSIGSNYKYLPYGNLNFPETAVRILHENQSAVLVVIGTDKKNKDWLLASSNVGNRLVLAGQQTNIVDYYQASDIYLESFPLGSLTATLDAVLYGAPVIRAPQLVLDILGLDCYDGMNSNAESIEEYCSYVKSLINDSSKQEELLQLQRQSVASAHTGDGWRQQRDTLLNSLPEHHLLNFAHQNVPTNGFEQSDEVWAELQYLHEGKKILSRAYFDNPAYSACLKPSMLDRLQALTLLRRQYHPEFRTVMLKINKQLPRV